MAFMLKIRWDIKKDKVADFVANQKALCNVMLEHPGVICYHVDYPSDGVSEWVEIYANDDAFRAHLANEKGKVTLLPTETYPPGSTNVDAQVLNLQNRKADVVLALALTNVAVSAIKFATQRGWKPQWVTSYANVSPEFIELGGSGVEGVVSGTFVKLPTDTDEGMQKHKKMLEKYVPGSKPSILTIFGQANAEFMVETLKRAGKDLTREGAIKAAESIKDFTCSVCLFPVSLSATDHETFESMKLMQVKDKRWVFITPPAK